MNQKTKETFAAPWEVKHHVHARWEVDFEIGTTDGMRVAVSPTEEHANRIAHIPEMYEALIDTNLEYCQKCFQESRWSTESAPSADVFIEHGCPKINRSSIIGCRRDHFWKLLKQVRDGK